MGLHRDRDDELGSKFQDLRPLGRLEMVQSLKLYFASLEIRGINSLPSELIAKPRSSPRHTVEYSRCVRKKKKFAS